MIRIIRRALAKRRLAQHRKANITRLSAAPKRDAWGRFAKGKIA